MIYLDSSAALKFVKEEKESAALLAWRNLLPRGQTFVTSALTAVEIKRTLIRSGVDVDRAGQSAEEALTGVHMVAVTRDVLVRADQYQVECLGSLDAIHLASADRFRAELTEFVTYDRELTAAAERLGLRVVAPA